MNKIIEALRQAVEHRERISLDDIDCINLLAEIERLRADLSKQQSLTTAALDLAEVQKRRLDREIERLRKDAARYQFIRAGNVYIEPHESGEIYMATFTGKYYTDLRDMDMDIDEAMTAPKPGEQE